jgi:predicted AAA+ superfamily ATPase
MQGTILRTYLLKRLERRLSKRPVVALLGARQVGKTTLARNHASGVDGEISFFDLERPSDHAALSANPEQILSQAEGLVVIDEVQRMPELFTLLRPLVDSPDRKAQFLLLGSASWDLVKGISETLAGRIAFINVGGFSLEEVGVEEQRRLWLQGGFPEAYLEDDSDDWQEWMEDFSRTFLERDIPGIGSKVAPQTLRRFWRMLAHYHGQNWNATELARSMDVSTTAVNHYRDLLEGTFMIRILPPWFENLGKRLVKSPKVYFRDSGVLHYLLNIRTWSDLYTHPRYGASWEGFAMEQILLSHGDQDAYFYATQGGGELDLLLFRKGRRYGFEFKCTDAPKTTKSMHTTFKDLKLDHLYVVYPGTRRFPLVENMSALPLREAGQLTFEA